MTDTEKKYTAPMSGTAGDLPELPKPARVGVWPGDFDYYTAHQVVNYARKAVAASLAAAQPLLLQDENSGRDGRRYNEWHASRPDARVNAREAAEEIHPPYCSGGCCNPEDRETPAPNSAWQPIETAPKDRIMLLSLPIAGNLQEGDRRVYEGRWHEDGKTFTSVNGFILLTAATHWMPLPSPPAAIESIERGAE